MCQPVAAATFSNTGKSRSSLMSAVTRSLFVCQFNVFSARANAAIDNSRTKILTENRAEPIECSANFFIGLILWLSSQTPEQRLSFIDTDLIIHPAGEGAINRRRMDGVWAGPTEIRPGLRSQADALGPAHNNYPAP